MFGTFARLSGMYVDFFIRRCTRPFALVGKLKLKTKYTWTTA